MKVSDLVDSYVSYRRSLGMRYHTQADFLKSFVRAAGDIDIREVRPDTIRTLLIVKGRVTASWEPRHSTLSGLYRFAICRGLADVCPLPTIRPQIPCPRTPHIYSVHEIKRLLSATASLTTPRAPLRGTTFRILLLVLYGSALRISEALSLTLQDVNLTDRLLTVRDTKFFKTRWVPIGPKLTEELRTYLNQRCCLKLPDGWNSALFTARTGCRWSYRTACKLFGRTRWLAGLHGGDELHSLPRLHDIRHTAAVHRVVQWYRSGANVQCLLPHLATYLGHVDLSSTQRYLTMTPELLQEAGRRFEEYAAPEACHE